MLLCHEQQMQFEGLFQQAKQIEKEQKDIKNKQPDPRLIDSMAMRYRHDFGLLDESFKNSIRVTMTQVWKEVVGLGFYKQQDK
jgi:hypothetical protein